MHFVKFCGFIFWNACFCSVKAFGGCARFPARFLSHEQFGGNLVHFLFFSGSCFCLSLLFVCFLFLCLLLVLFLFVWLLFSVCCCWCCCCCFCCCFLVVVFLLLFSCCCFLVVVFSCCFLVVVVIVLICPRTPSQNNILKALFFHGLLPFPLPPSFSSFCFFPSFLLSVPSLASKSKKQKKKGTTGKKEMKREIRGQNG